MAEHSTASTHTETGSTYVAPAQTVKHPLQKLKLTVTDALTAVKSGVYLRISKPESIGKKEKYNIQKSAKERSFVIK